MPLILRHWQRSSLWARHSTHFWFLFLTKYAVKANTQRCEYSQFSSIAIVFWWAIVLLEQNIVLQATVSVTGRCQLPSHNGTYTWLKCVDFCHPLFIDINFIGSHSAPYKIFVSRVATYVYSDSSLFAHRVHMRIIYGAINAIGNPEDSNSWKNCTLIN